MKVKLKPNTTEKEFLLITYDWIQQGDMGVFDIQYLKNNLLNAELMIEENIYNIYGIRKLDNIHYRGMLQYKLNDFNKIWDIAEA